MSEREDYVDHNRPPNRLLAVLSRRRWLLLSLLLAVNLISAAAVWYARESSRSPEDRLRHDPIEDNARVRPTLDQAGREAEQELAARGIKPQFGYCHAYWHTKQRILKEKYGVDWRTPAEMNPDVAFD